MDIDVDATFFTTREVADWLRVAPLTIYKWRKKGLPYQSVGGIYRYQKKQVLFWLTQQQAAKKEE